MMQNMVHPQERPPIEEITSPLGAQILEFCESELFQETLQNSEVASNSNCGYDQEHSSYPPHDHHDLSITHDMIKYTTTLDNNDIPPPATAAGPSTPTAVATRNTNLSAVFLDDDLENAIDFTSSPSFSVPHRQYFNNHNSQEPFNIEDAGIDGFVYAAPSSSSGGALGWSPLLTGFEEANNNNNYINLRTSCLPSCTIVDPIIGPYFASGNISAPFWTDNSGIFTGGTNGLFSGSDFTDFQRDNGGLFFSDSMARVFNCSSGDLQALSSESQQRMLHGSPSTTLATEISSLEDPTFKVGKLSAEERKRKIHKYMKKRNERNFSKKIKYACRKTLADSRPRVRGRFAKNDELGDQINNGRSTTNSSTGPIINHEDHDTDEDLTLVSNHEHHNNKAVKGEEDMDSSEIFAHISGVNSMKCNYPIQSWI